MKTKRDRKAEAARRVRQEELVAERLHEESVNGGWDQARAGSLGLQADALRRYGRLTEADAAEVACREALRLASEKRAAWKLAKQN